MDSSPGGSVKPTARAQQEVPGRRSERMKTISGWGSLFVILVAVAALAVCGVTPASAQSVTTDQSEYHRGNIVTVIGSAPAETISLLINESPANNLDVLL